MFGHQNEGSSWNFDLQSSDISNNAVFTEVQNSMSDPAIWDSVRRTMDTTQNQSMNGFPTSDSLLGDLRYTNGDVRYPNYSNDFALSREGEQCSGHKDNLLETVIKAPALLMDTWKEISGIKMAEQMVLSVLQNPEAMKLAVMAIQTGMLA